MVSGHVQSCCNVLLFVSSTTFDTFVDFLLRFSSSNAHHAQVGDVCKFPDARIPINRDSFYLRKGIIRTKTTSSVDTAKTAAPTTATKQTRQAV